jgi:hypothetical protein
MWPQRQDSEAGVKDYAAELEGRRQAELERYRAGIKDAIMQSWPAELAKSAYGAATLPGDVYAGRVDPMSDEAVGRSAELAGLLTLGAGGVPAGRNEMRMGIKAYHGSPHDFDQFSMSKIGTGEGAQAYGHGLYFADKEGIAKGYRDALTPAVNAQKPGYRSSQDWLDQFSSPIEARKEVDSMIGIIRARGDEKLAKEYELIRHHLDNPYAGRMYEVELNTTPDRLLDWDKPRDLLSPSVQDFAKTKHPQAWEAAADGSSLYNLVQKEIGPQNTANAFRERGIDGIKYLDAGSRAAGDGSRNYVMFDDKLIKILRKYGVATAAALPAAALAELGLSRKEAERTF